ncbi:hypothetical protein ABNF65_23355 [Paenibacillus larvae]
MEHKLDLAALLEYIDPTAALELGKRRIKERAQPSPYQTNKEE